RRFAVAMFEEGDVTAANEAVVVSKILQVASGAVKHSEGVNEIDCASKFDALDEILEASTQPVIIYAPYRAAIDRIEKHLDGKKVAYSVVYGGVSTDDRRQAFDALQSGLIRVLIAHPQAIAHGLTLTNSNVI